VIDVKNNGEADDHTDRCNLVHAHCVMIVGEAFVFYCFNKPISEVRNSGKQAGKKNKEVA
jgi:hypothetical protein